MYPRGDEGEVAQMHDIYKDWDESTYVAPSDQHYYDSMMKEFGFGGE